jgi:biopolymer transport protein ExbB
MVTTFGVLTAVGTAEPQAVSRGISCALLTTQAGLLIALPGLYGREWLRRWEERVAGEVRRLRSVLVERGE